jgi:flavin-binding protein dodecin
VVSFDELPDEPNRRPGQPQARLLYLISSHGRISIMSENHVYKKIEIIGSSPVGIEDAIKNALDECSKTLHHLEWFEVVDTRGHIVDGKVAHYQVSLKIGMRIQPD